MLGSILVALGLSILARNVGLIDDRGLVLASLTSVGMVLIASFAIRRHKPWAKKKATFHGALGLVFLSVGITVYLDPSRLVASQPGGGRSHHPSEGLIASV